MIRTILHTLTAILLSCSLLLGGSAKEFVHLWAHHQDTLHDVHHECPKGEAHFEPEHHHCEFLGFVLAPFDGFAFRPVIVYAFRPIPPILYHEYRAVFQPAFVAHKPSRGPPAPAVQIGICI